MSGIGHVLSVAKEALMAHQLSIQVTGHNVANVDTPGYTRQSLSLKANPATPVGAGQLGGGVRGDEISRHYDKFMIERLAEQSSLLGNLAAQQQAMRVVEPIFNETKGLALNDLLNQFWNSWQELSDNPETLASRQNVVQSGQLLVDQFAIMSNEIIRARHDIGVNLDTGIQDVNSITQRIAALNVRIATAESSKAQANDLRDQRDNLVQELSGLLDITYFENKNGNYTVLMADGHSLVEIDQYWKVDWSDGQLLWSNTSPSGEATTTRSIGAGAELGGKVGGWMEVYNELAAGNPNNYSGRLDALANAIIREVNQLHSQGSGAVRFSDELIGAELASPTLVTTGLLDVSSSSKGIPAGIMSINGLKVGEIKSGAITEGLAMAKAANAVTAINKIEAGVEARLTTQVAGTAVDVTNLADGDTLSFTVNGVTVDYTVDIDGTAPDDDDPANFAASLAAATNAALAAHNGDNANLPPKLNIEAVVGDGTNGGALNSIIFRNTQAGDETAIIIDDLDGNFTGGATTASLGFETIKGNSYKADASHNTGEITIFSAASFTMTAGVDDTYLIQLGLTNIAGDTPGDGRFTAEASSSDPLMILGGYQYGDQLNVDDGSFDLWIYNADGSLALAQPVNVSMERVYTLQDAADAINNAVANAGGITGSTSWVQATVVNNRIRLEPQGGREFAFANDTSNFLQVAGLNTFFSGHNAGTITINSMVAKELNYLAAGQVGENGQIYTGDNTNALAITGLQQKDSVSFVGGKVNSLNGFYNALIGDIGNRGRTVDRSVEFNTLIFNQMSEMRDSVSGVNLDEEMANLIKFQHAYTAAARLISKADEMLVTLLDTVR